MADTLKFEMNVSLVGSTANAKVIRADVVADAELGNE